jgi:hypothetical protein
MMQKLGLEFEGTPGDFDAWRKNLLRVAGVLLRELPSDKLELTN